MAGALFTICRSAAADAGPAAAGSVACRRWACSILPSSFRLQNSAVFRLLPLPGMNDLHLSGSVALDGVGAKYHQYAAICALFLESFTKRENLVKSGPRSLSRAR
jgi:hypothetical protein